MEKTFEEWSKQNPGGKFHQYYVESVCEHLAEGKPHSTLGKKLLRGAFDQSGTIKFNFLIGEGLKPEHVCVDYGCGSLRIGQHLIKYLNPSDYWGLDVTDKFYEMGKEMIGPDLIRAKQPHVHVISPASLASVRAASPDFLIAASVLMHIPPGELEDFIKNIASACVPKTKAYISTDIVAKTIKAHDRTWFYSKRDMSAVLDKLPITYAFMPAPRESIKGFEVEKTWLTIKV